MPIEWMERAKAAQHRLADKIIAKIDAAEDQQAAEKQAQEEADADYRAKHTHDRIGDGEFSDDPKGKSNGRQRD